MARIRTIKRIAGASTLHPTAVDAEWSIVTLDDGTAIFQLSTFGSDDRVSKPKVSQTIQLDAQMARELRDALDATFPQNH